MEPTAIPLIPPPCNSCISEAVVMEMDALSHFDAMPADVLDVILSFLPVCDLFHGIWALNRRCHALLRQPNSSVWLNSYALQWKYPKSQLQAYSKDRSWLHESRERLKLDLAQLSPLEPFASYFNLRKDSSAKSAAEKARLAHLLQDAYLNWRWSRAVEGNLDMLFDENFEYLDQFKNTFGLDILRTMFVERRSWYVVSRTEIKDHTRVASTHRVAHAHFVIYSTTAERLRFFYTHEWQDIGSESVLHPRYLSLYLGEKGIFDTKSTSLSRETLQEAKVALLGEKNASSVSDEVIIVFLLTIGIFSVEWKNQKHPLWTHELNEPFKFVQNMVSGSMSHTNRVPSLVLPTSFRRLNSNLDIAVPHAELLKFVSPAAASSSTTKGFHDDGDDDDGFWYGQIVCEEEDFELEDVLVSTGVRNLPLHAQKWEFDSAVDFDQLVVIVRAQLMLESHLNRWFSDAPKLFSACLGLENIINLFHSSNISVDSAVREIRRDNGSGYRCGRTQFTLHRQEAVNDAVSAFFPTTTFIFKFGAGVPDWCAPYYHDFIELYYVVDDSISCILRYHSAGEGEASRDSQRDCRGVFQQLRERLFGSVEVSRELLLATLSTIGLCADSWRQGEHLSLVFHAADDDRSMRNKLPELFNAALKY